MFNILKLFMNVILLPLINIYNQCYYRWRAVKASEVSAACPPKKEEKLIN